MQLPGQLNADRVEIPITRQKCLTRQEQHHFLVRAASVYAATGSLGELERSIAIRAAAREKQQQFLRTRGITENGHGSRACITAIT